MIHAGSEPTSPLRYMRCECDVGFLPILHAFAPPLLRAPRAYPSSPPHASPPRFVPPLPCSFVHAPPQPRTTPHSRTRRRLRLRDNVRPALGDGLSAWLIVVCVVVLWRYES